MSRMRRGFGLIEILLSVTIISLLSVGLIGLFSLCFKMQQRAEHYTDAFQQIRGELEEIKATSFSTILSWTDPPYSGSYEEPLANDLNGRLRVEVSKVSTDEGESSSLLDIRIIAGWAEADGTIIGEGSVDGSGTPDFEFSEVNGTPGFQSPVELRTAIARK